MFITEKKKIYIYIHNGILLSYKKSRYSALCGNIDEPWAHYTKWDKSAWERQIPYGITYMWNLNMSNS